jgi:hypothetical protein
MSTIKRKKTMQVMRPWNLEDEDGAALISSIINGQKDVIEKEAAIDELKGPLKSAKEALETAVKQLSDGKETEVEGYEIIDLKKGTVKMFDDNGNTIGMRDATDDDREPQAFDEEVE